MLILLTNDDGIEALGLRSLRPILEQLGEVVTVAPSEERSATSHSLTIHDPIRILPQGERAYAVTGTPVDCVILALRKILDRLPDLVVSGINHGPNLGDDVMYSGTVAAAREAALCGIPALAVSSLSRRPEVLVSAADIVKLLIQEFEPQRLPQGTFLNINLPSSPYQGYRVTRQGSKLVASEVQEKQDPRGRAYFWIAEDQSEWVVETDTDYEAIRQGLVSVTPLQRDQTDYRLLEVFAERSREKARSGGED